MRMGVVEYQIADEFGVCCSTTTLPEKKGSGELGGVY
jgi:hypothetical protein